MDGHSRGRRADGTRPAWSGTQEPRGTAVTWPVWTWRQGGGGGRGAGKGAGAAGGGGSAPLPAARGRPWAASAACGPIGPGSSVRKATLLGPQHFLRASEGNRGCQGTRGSPVSVPGSFPEAGSPWGQGGSFPPDTTWKGFWQMESGLEEGCEVIVGDGSPGRATEQSGGPGPGARWAQGRMTRCTQPHHQGSGLQGPSPEK